MTKKTKHRLLRQARSIIERGWCQGCEARDRNGNWVPTFSNKAVKFCTWGGVERAREELGIKWSPDEAFAIEDLLLSCTKNQDDIANWNDMPSRRKSQVLSLYDRAIAKLTA